MQPRLAMALAFVLTLPSASRGQVTPPAETLRALLELDADRDRAVSRGEVPEAARESFDVLLRHGDTNDNGLLEGDEVRTLLQRVRQAGPGTIDPAEARRRLRAADKDGDGLVSRAEFPGLPLIFDRLDRDGNGSLSPQELRRAAESTPAAGPPAIADRIRRQDRDGDGKVTREEFRGAAAQFDRLDRDGNGVLEPSEFGGPAAKPSNEATSSSPKNGKPRAKDGRKPRPAQAQEGSTPAPSADVSQPSTSR